MWCFVVFVSKQDIRVRKRKKEQTGSAGGQLSSSSAEEPGERDDRTTNTGESHGLISLIHLTLETLLANLANYFC